MSSIRSRKFLVPLLAFLLLDLLAVGAGMGVPIFAIPFGFLTGWFAPPVLADTAPDLPSLLRRCVIAALLTSAFTFLLMLLIWGPKVRMLFDPTADIAHFGIPMILYEPARQLRRLDRADGPPLPLPAGPGRRLRLLGAPGLVPAQGHFVNKLKGLVNQNRGKLSKLSRFTPFRMDTVRMPTSGPYPFKVKGQITKLSACRMHPIQNEKTFAVVPEYTVNRF